MSIPDDLLIPTVVETDTTIGELYDLHAGTSGRAAPADGVVWTICVNGYQRDIEAIDGPALARRRDSYPFTLELSPVDGEPGTCGAKARDMVMYGELIAVWPCADIARSTPGWPDKQWDPYRRTDDRGQPCRGRGASRR